MSPVITSESFSIFESFSNVQVAAAPVMTAGDPPTTITWNRQSTTLDLVKIYLSTNSGGDYTLIGGKGSVGNDQSEPWNIPTDKRSEQCRIKIENYYNDQNFAETALVDEFTIKEKIDVTVPNAGTQPWTVLNTYTIEFGMQWFYT